MFAPYLQRDAREAYVPGNGRCVLATQERDLKAEADDLDGCYEAAAEVTMRCYPAVVLVSGTLVIHTIQN